MNLDPGVLLVAAGMAPYLIPPNLGHMVRTLLTIGIDK